MSTPLYDPIPHLTAVLESMDLFIAPPEYTDKAHKWIRAILPHGKPAMFFYAYLQVASAAIVRAHIEELYRKESDGIPPF